MRNILLALVLWSVAARGSSPLDSAWLEYRFQNWSRSEKLFRDVLRESAPATEAGTQAALGLALIDHYRMPGSRPDRAVAQYHSLLAQLPHSHPLRPRLRLFAGRAYAYMDPPDTSGAYAEFDSAIASQDPPVRGETLPDRHQQVFNPPQPSLLVVIIVERAKIRWLCRFRSHLQ